MMDNLPYFRTGQRDLLKQVGYDVWLIVAALALCICGAIFVWTSSAAYSWRLTEGDSMTIFLNHVGRLGWGLLCMVGLAFVNYRWLGRMSRYVWLASLVLLVAVLFWHQPQGVTAHRWIYIGSFSFQPAEFAKFALVLYLAWRFSEFRQNPFAAGRRKFYASTLTIVMITFVLILKEPNYSMCLMVLATAAFMFFLFGIPLWIIGIVAAALAVPLSLIAWLTPYMRDRLTPYFTSLMHPLTAEYHVRQSLIGISHGGIFGLGLGGSTQKHFFLPKPYKDFVFSIVGEELGMIGAVGLLLIFLFLFWRTWRIARQAPDALGYFLAMGITCAIALGFIVNIGVTLAVLPATGQPLPFISFGGSSLMMTLGAMGVLINISRQTLRPKSDAPHWIDRP
jgi:cell division protein FtsW